MLSEDDEAIQATTGKKKCFDTCKTNHLYIMMQFDSAIIMLHLNGLNEFLLSLISLNKKMLILYQLIDLRRSLLLRCQILAKLIPYIGLVGTLA